MNPRVSLLQHVHVLLLLNALERILLHFVCFIMTVFLTTTTTNDVFPHTVTAIKDYVIII